MKGQWFIISAVIASSVFLGLSLLLKEYFVADASTAAKFNNDFYFYNIGNQLDNIVRNTITNPADCSNLTTSLNEFKTISEKDLATKGVLLTINYTGVQCSPNVVRFNYILASDNGIIYNFTTLRKPSELIG